SPANLGKIKGIPELKDVQVTLVPGHDTSCAYDAMPASEDGTDFYISSGTWSLMGFESDKPVLGKDALKACISNERMGDGRYRPLTNCQGLWLLEQILPSFSSQPKSNADWKRLITAAQEEPAPKGLINVADRSLFNPVSMKDAIDKQLKRRKLKAPKTLAGYTRLICESLGKGHADGVARFEKMTGKTFKRILIVGGGSKNPLLCQTTANYSKLPVVSFSLEGTAVGNMANQLIALGAVESIPAFRRQLLKGLKKKVYQPKG
ncbi:MAG: rhamnulokinase, partial [Opitutaceae bacterium]|nr:rhamnulokinase [Opitutaceae bacterium]